MKFAPPVVSAFVSPRARAKCAVGAAVLAMGLGCMGRGVCADTDASVAAIVSDSIAAARTRQLSAVTVTPEVSTVRTRLVPMALSIDSRPLSELAGMHYRLWMSRGRADVGVGIGTIGYVVPNPEGRIEGPLALSGTAPTLSVGVRYRVTSDSAVYADASGARGLGVDQSANYVNTKVGMEWKPAKRSFGFERGAIGMHFDSGYHLSVNARRGGLGLYLRGQF